jgi:carbonic anhydrase/acetyltransferase-like protein (isoleucine patch superfamily)
MKFSVNKLIYNLIFKLKRALFFLVYKKCFCFLGSGTYIVAPFRFDGESRISLGNNVFIQRGIWLYCEQSDDSLAKLEIGNGCVFGYNNHITCVKEVKIGDNVLTANNVYISDNSHGYNNVNIPIMYQPIVFKGCVSIGCGTWIGENAVIIGANVGKNCVIAANAVVTKNIPDYCVVAGVPAQVIRRYDVNSKKWISQL